MILRWTSTAEPVTVSVAAVGLVAQGTDAADATYTFSDGVWHLLALDLAATSSTATSRAATAASSSSRSAAACARLTRPTCASRTSATTSARIRPPAPMSESAGR